MNAHLNNFLSNYVASAPIRPYTNYTYKTGNYYVSGYALPFSIF